MDCDIGQTDVDRCPLCNKLFNVASSYKRHITYCKRTHGKPRKRQKSCRACSTAKAKCSFDAPSCSRCVSRGIDCIYDHLRKPNAASASSIWNGRNKVPVLETGRSDHLQFEHTMLDEVGLSQVILASNAGQRFIDLSFCDIPAATVIEDDFSQQIFCDLTPENGAALFHEMNTLCDINQIMMGNPSTEMLISSTPRLGTLAQLRPHSIMAQRQANLLLQSLRTFPQKMLNRGNDLPFFIHSYHQRAALPEPLAVCSRICQMFDTRTPDILPFLFRCIMSETQRYMSEPMSKDDLLAASQAQIVYIMMLVIESGMRKMEWVQQVLMMSGAVCQRLFMVSVPEMHRQYAPFPDSTWDEWVYLESRKRKLIVWFIMSLIFSTQTGISCNNILEIRMLALPASRRLWESSDPPSFERNLALENTCPLQTFGDLMDAHANHADPLAAKALDNWASRSDQLGSLLDIAISILQ